MFFLQGRSQGIQEVLGYGAELRVGMREMELASEAGQHIMYWDGPALQSTQPASTGAV